MKRRMSKMLVVLLIVVMSISIIGCGSTENLSNQVSNEQVTVGFIFVGAQDDYGYNQAAYLGSIAVEEYFGDSINVLRSENVPETAEASRVLEQMIQQGASILFPTSYGHLEPALEVAEKNEDVVFFHQGGLKTSENLGTYFGTIWECFYLSGMAAGASTESNKLGFVASFPIPQVLANINAFQLGAQSVNPDVTTTVIFTGSWNDPALQTSSANTLIDAGVDVITQHQDSTKTIVELCESAGIYTTGNHTDASTLASSAWLTGATWNWGPLFIDMTQTAIDNDFKESIYDGKYRGGLAEGVIDIAPFGSSVSKETQEMILAAKQAMIEGDLFAFEGEIKTQDGTVVVASGEKMTIDEIESMDYLVEGIIGTVN